MSIDDYYKKRKEEQLIEAYDLFFQFARQYKAEPGMEVFDEFFWLFWNRNQEIPDYYKRQMDWHDRYKETEIHFLCTQPLFNGFDDSRKYCREKMQE